MKNTGKPYEALTQQVFQRLLAQTGGICTKVERDVVLVGKGTRHQVDVTFEFVAGPVRYRTIVQCKDWASAVKQEQVLAFREVLNDIPGQPRGIIVSRSGFQEGARRLAQHHGVVLYELREPRGDDWNGLIRTTNVKFFVESPQFEVRLIPDQAWIREEGICLGVAPGTRVTVEPSSGTLVTDSGDTYDLRSGLAKYIPSESGESVRIQHRFDERVFLNAVGCPIPRLLLAGVDVTITLHMYEREIQASVDHLIAYCFRDVLGGTVQFLGHDGEPLSPV